jgi:hypothetical protein
MQRWHDDEKYNLRKILYEEGDWAEVVTNCVKESGWLEGLESYKLSTGFPFSEKDKLVRAEGISRRRRLLLRHPRFLILARLVVSSMGKCHFPRPPFPVQVPQTY